MLLVLFSILGTTVAMASGKPVDPPPSTPVTQPITVDLDATLKAQAAAAATAKAQASADALSNSTAITGPSTSNATGTGGRSSSGSYAAGGNGGSGGALNDNSSTRMYVLPAPVWSSVPQAAGCIVTESTALSGGWNFVSGSRSSQKSDPVCVGIIMAKAAYEHCHFESEAMITQRIYETAFPGAPALPITPGLRNLSLAECEDIKNPRLTLAPAITPIQPVVVAPPAPVPAPVATLACPEPPKPVKRRVVKPTAKPVAPACPVPAK